MIYRLLMLFSIITLLASCASRKSDINYTKQNSLKNSQLKNDNANFLSIKKIPKFRSRQYLIAPGHQFALSHPSDDKLKGKYRVNFNGLLKLPYNVRIQADGLTLSKLKSLVRKAYKRYFQAGVNKVSLTLLSRSYYVELRGLVNKPGRYLVARNLSIDRVIDLAGGLKGDLKSDFMTAVMNQRGKSFTISLNQYYENITFSKAFTWTGGDSIFISLMNDDSVEKSMPMISVVGGVTKPGKIIYKRNKDLFYYLNKAGGVQSSISLDEAYIIRKTRKGLKRIRFDITDMALLPAIRVNDVILISSKQETAWDKILQKTSQVTGILASIALLLFAL
jgi:protein involved in polysaccharide export with SLBB domain